MAYTVPEAVTSATVKAASTFDDSLYGMVPSKGGNMAFAILFGILLILHTSFAIIYRQRWIGVTFFIGLGFEFIGYIARTIASDSPNNKTQYLCEMISLTLAPVFIMAGYYYLLAQMAVIYGPTAALIKPIYYSYIFIFCDIFSLLLQAAGGGAASSAVHEHKSTLPGTHIMLAGLAFQVFTMSIFLFLWLQFFYQVYWGSDKCVPPNEVNKATFYDTSYKDHIFAPEYAHIRERKQFQIFPMAILLGTITIYIRCIYRVIELAQGWSGYLITHERYIFVLDGMMILISSALVAAFYPGRIFGRGNVVTVPKALVGRRRQKNKTDGGASCDTEERVAAGSNEEK